MLSTRNINIIQTTRQSTILRYRGIAAEINHPHGDLPESSANSFGYKSRYGWCLYIYLHLDNFADKETADSLWIDAVCDAESSRKWYRLYNNDFLASIDLHGGITFYEKYFSRNDTHAIKIGCDYHHLRDNDEAYSVDSLVRDAQRAIDSIHNMETYLMFCQNNGALVREDVGGYTSDGDFYCFDCVKQSAGKRGWKSPLYNYNGVPIDLDDIDNLPVTV